MGFYYSMTQPYEVLALPATPLQVLFALGRVDTLWLTRFLDIPYNYSANTVFTAHA